MLRNIYTTNTNNEVLSLSFGHCLKKHADFDVPKSDRNNRQFKTPMQDRFFVFNRVCFFFSFHDYHLLLEQQLGI